jgi:ATP-dependent protease ClpP protease subunit
VIIDYVKFRENAVAMVDDGYIPIFGEFNDQMSEIVNECIWKAKKGGKKEVTLLIDSNGGNNNAFNSIRATMIESGITYRGLVLGRAYSNGFNILQACHTREALSGANLMFHWGSQTFNNAELTALIDGEAWVLEFAIERELQTMRMVAKRTGISEKELRKIAAQERYYPAKFALKANMIDRILDVIPAKVKESLKEVRLTEPEAIPKRKRRSDKL